MAAHGYAKRFVQDIPHAFLHVIPKAGGAFLVNDNVS